MSLTLQLEAAASHSISLLLQWPRADCGINALRRLLACQSADTQQASNPTPTSGDRNGWAIVPVLNELLDRTASQQPLPPTPTKDDPTARASPRHRKRQRPVCTNCRRVFSVRHDAASRPLDGFCSVDCRASHTYMDAIASDADAKLKPFVSGTSPTLDCENSCFSPATPQLTGDCRFPTVRGPHDAGPAIYARP